jgi:hypothetical protein
VLYDGRHQDDAAGPSQQRHYPRYQRRPPFWRRDGMTDRDVSVGAHDAQEDGACELVDAGGDHVSLAGGIAEDPLFVDHGYEEEGDADEEALVGYGQVHYVHVGNGLHFGETDHYVDYQSVTNQTHQTYHGEQDGLEDYGHCETLFHHAVVDRYVALVHLVL